MALIATPRLDRRVTIEKATKAKDATFGSSKSTWATLCRVWAERRDDLPSRSEGMQEGLRVGSNRARYRIRWRGDVDATMRVVEQGVVYQIIGGPAEIGRHEYLELYCERTSAGST